MKYEIYTDGACSGNPGPGGIGYVILKDGERIHSGAKGYNKTTNNRMEIIAVIRAVYDLMAIMQKVYDDNEKDTVTICTDSDIVYGTMTKNYKRKANKDLWTGLDAVLSRLAVRDIGGVEISFEKVDGHRGVKWNEEADKLAVAARESDRKAADAVYEREHPEEGRPVPEPVPGKPDDADIIKTLFARLDDRQKVDVLVSLYWRLRDAQKDEFLRETDNA